MATVALVLGLVSWVVGGLLTAIPGAVIGKMELNKIDRGESPEAGRTFAAIGFWASLIHIIVSLLAMIVACVIFGGAILAMIGIGASQAPPPY
jgi:uncharacterized membrane protein